MNEILTQQEERFFDSHGLVMLKPDALELYLENMFIRDFEELGIATAYRQFLGLSEADLRFIYPEWVSNPAKFKAIRANMANRQSLIMIMHSEKTSGNDEDLQERIRRLKGRADEPGLRNKYIHIFGDELARLYPDKEVFINELNKNRIHSPDSPLEALNTLVYFWPRLIGENMTNTLPELCDIISKRLKGDRNVARQISKIH